MSEDKPKTIQEALAEVQRLVNETRAARVAQMVAEIQDENIDEGILGDVIKGGMNVAKNFGRGVKGMNVQGLRAPTGKFGSATSVERGANVLGKNAGKITATAGAATAAGMAAGGKSAPTSAPKPEEAPKASAPATKSKYSGGKPHNVTTLAPTAPGTQGKVQSKKTEKGWADPGRWENEAKAKTGSMQQIRGGKVLPPSSQLGTPKDEKSTQSFLNKELGRKKVSESHIDEAGLWGAGAEYLMKNAPKITSSSSSSLLNKAKNVISGAKTAVVDKVKSATDTVKSAAPKVAAGAIGGAIGGSAASSSSSDSDRFKDIPRTTLRTPGSPEAKAAATQLKADKKKPSVGASGDVMKPGGGSLPTQSKYSQSKIGNVDVKRGDTLSGLAKKHGVSLDKLMKDNPHIKDANKISAGSRIVVNKEEVESPMIMSFLELMNTDHGNVFEAAKHLSAKQKKIAAVAGDPNKIDADDFKVLRSKKMEEASVDHLGSSTVTKSKTGYVDPSTPTKPYTKAPMSTKAGDVISKAKGAAGIKEEVDLDDFIEYHLEEGYDINDIVDFIEENYQLDELSKKTLASYIKKASIDMAARENVAGSAHQKARYRRNPERVESLKKFEKKHEHKSAQRMAGIAKAADKLTKEEVEFSESEIEYINSIMNTEGDNE